MLYEVRNKKKSITVKLKSGGYMTDAVPILDRFCVVPPIINKNEISQAGFV